MTEKNKSIGVSKFIIEQRDSFTYANLKLELFISKKPNVIISDKIDIDDDLKKQLIIKMKKWVDFYANKDIYITANLVSFKLMNGNLDISRGITLAFHDGLPKIGIKPPQIFTL
ncbi:hypothetical protein [Mesonia oceanica]|uniref:hypothetical protein n=1 Tax=Mesonia oceanica TaxID=2687242 RepID=UPI00123F2452|nr:hypothetical protein [Mesonia oceanica]